ncbi:mucin-2 [Patella vulgata]|uniref:mucin-2 n=1 Tax=Patella vulgata TaxID=6465 RepID=UPI00217FFF7C|nr:mucin-2 [Patella vulgata]
MVITILCRFASAFNFIFLWTVLIEFNNQIFAMEEVSLYKHPLRMPCRFPVKRQTYVRDPLDCSIFYTCYGNRYWRMTCSTPHTIWSLKYKVCVWQNTAFDDCNYANTKTTSPLPRDDLKQKDFDTSNELEIKPEPWEKTTRYWVTWKTGTTVQPYTPFVPFSTSTQTSSTFSTTPAVTSRTTKMFKHVKPVVVIERKTPQPKFTWRTIHEKTTTSKKSLKTVSKNPFSWRSPSTARPTTPRPKRTTTKATTKRPTTSSRTTDRLTSTRSTTTRRPTTVRTTPRPTTPRPTTPRPTTKTTNRPTTEITTSKARARFTWDPNFWKQLTKKPFRATTRKPFWNIITKRPVIWIPRQTKPVVTEKPTRATIKIPIEWQRLNESPYTRNPTLSKTTKKPKIVTRKPSTPRPPSTTKRPTKTTTPPRTTPTTTRRKVTWLPRTTWRPTTRILTTPSTTTSTTTAITTTLAATRDITSPQIVERNTEINLRSDTTITVPTVTEPPSTSISIEELTTLQEEIANSRNSDKCGVMPTPLIIGGKPSSPGRWPWQVSLQIIAAIEPWHRCGGVLIHPNWVLTAAHCVEG